MPTLTGKQIQELSKRVKEDEKAIAKVLQEAPKAIKAAQALGSAAKTGKQEMSKEDD